MQFKVHFIINIKGNTLFPKATATGFIKNISFYHDSYHMTWDYCYPNNLTYNNSANYIEKNYSFVTDIFCA